MKKVDKTAIILGATGLTGSILLHLLLHDDRYTRIKVFTRKSLEISHPKLVEFKCDILKLAEQEQNFTADEVFCCTGTTKAKTPDEERYRTIDYGIPVAAASLSKKNDIPSFLVVSAIGADRKSSIFYNRIKGEMEAAVLDIGLPKTHVLQPSLIGGNRNESRPGEYLFKQFMKVFKFAMVGSLRKYRTISPKSIAETMLWLANNPYIENRLPSDIISKLAENK
ncbi:Rossmann-fold NAD(P)-binding domain-containing protein [Maribacter antarcticus]|uniref:NAD(P)H-binding protein n=1 Tax=Maribacter antarcticus TaxID=505250 RepID=UPI00047E6D8B|nr:NAD(P)H-binding protein [Maribacter antarcticus]